MRLKGIKTLTLPDDAATLILDTEIQINGRCYLVSYGPDGVTQDGRRMRTVNLLPLKPR